MGRLRMHSLSHDMFAIYLIYIGFLYMYVRKLVMVLSVDSVVMLVLNKHLCLFKLHKNQALSLGILLISLLQNPILNHFLHIQFHNVTYRNV